jgi:hypothetical protein
MILSYGFPLVLQNSRKMYETLCHIWWATTSNKLCVGIRDYGGGYKPLLDSSSLRFVGQLVGLT